MRNYVLKKICDCTIEQQMRILTIRNSQSVRKSMYTEHIIGVNEHLQWIDGLKADSQRQIFVILKNSDLAVGVVGLSKIDFLQTFISIFKIWTRNFMSKIKNLAYFIFRFL